MSLLRSWDVGTAREPARRAGLVIGLAQLPLRPLVTLLSRPDRPLTPDAVRSSCFSKREWEIILARWRRDVRLMGERPTIWL